MADLINIKLSLRASGIAKDMVEKYGFRDAMTFFQFAMSYALSNHLKEINFEQLDSDYDSMGSNYNVGSIKKANLIITTLDHIIPNCETPYRFIRVLMIYGTYKIQERLDAGEKFEDIIAIS